MVSHRHHIEPASYRHHVNGALVRHLHKIPVYLFLSNTTLSDIQRPPLLVSQFNLFIDEQGILRAMARIKNADINSECKEPILLPSRHYYSDLIIQDYHVKVFHNGIRETLNAIRQKYWTLRLRESVKKFVRRCVTVNHRISPPPRISPPSNKPPMLELQIVNKPPLE